MSSDSPIKVREFSAASLPSDNFREEWAGFLERLLGENNVSIRRPSQSTGNWEILVKNRVGMVQLPNGPALVIEPKVPIQSLVEMLQWADARFVKVLPRGQVQVQVAALVPAWLAVFSRAVDHLVSNGLAKTYVSREARLPFGRGRLVPAASLRRPLDPQLVYRFAELTVDNTSNQALLAGIMAALRVQGLQESARLALRKAALTLRPHVQSVRMTAEEVRSIRYTATNRHYKPVLDMAALVLAGVGPSWKIGETGHSPFLLDTPKIFETFIVGWLKSRLEPLGYSVQHEPSVLLQPGISPIYPDIVISDPAGKSIAVLDTKYKDRFYHSDVYQIIAYAKKMGVTRGALVYPQSPDTLLDTSVGTSEPIYCLALVFDLGKGLDQAGLAFEHALHSLLGTGTPMPNTAPLVAGPT